jgi:hypothetical protein
MQGGAPVPVGRNGEAHEARVGQSSRPCSSRQDAASFLLEHV